MKVKFNIKNVHYAPYVNDEFKTPVAFPGAVAIALQPKGDIEHFYADGLEYYTTSGGEGYEGDLEVALIPDGFRKDILNEIEDENKVLLEDLNKSVNKMALGFDIDGDGKTTRFWFLNCTASRPGTESKTDEGKKTPITDKLTIKCAPNANGIVRAKTTENTTEQVYADWYKSVYTPNVVSE